VSIKFMFKLNIGFDPRPVPRDPKAKTPAYTLLAAEGCELVTITTRLNCEESIYDHWPDAINVVEVDEPSVGAQQRQLSRQGAVALREQYKRLLVQAHDIMSVNDHRQPLLTTIRQTLGLTEEAREQET
jgi:hypothetical protein